MTPILVGVAQTTYRTRDGPPVDPLTLLARTARHALDDAGAADVVGSIDAVTVVSTVSWEYDCGNSQLPVRLATLLQARPTHYDYTRMGGDSPQVAINRACAALEGGQVRAVLIGGVEATNSVLRIARDPDSTPADWPAQGERQPFDRTSPIMEKYGLHIPIRVYPLIETAIRARSGRSPQEHALHMGRLFSRYSQIASENPLAWFRTPHTPEALATPSPSNRMVVYPYAKNFMAFPMVDQAACVILTTVEHARALGIPENKWIYPMGGANFIDVEDVTARINLDESPGVRYATRLALDQAGLCIKDITLFDIYSCFPSAVQVGLKEIGIDENDPRPFTVTGGLPYFGGPGNNYSMHAIVSMVEQLRVNKTATGLVWANGMYITKHAIGVYGHRPAQLSWTQQATRLPSIQELISSSHSPECVLKLEGSVRIEAFMILHDKDKPTQPKWGVALVRQVVSNGLMPGGRTLARIEGTAEELAQLETIELVGLLGTVRHDAKTGFNYVRVYTPPLLVAPSIAKL